ncbi:hypothetical protein [Gracilibacillus boraciitolerans]|uniref:hypothetical protein n=1 Tax=Gracilibacillus boraciitolerans TaxID=307521 RepID=UPI00054F4E63|nr:hypothetical protein [Gracilibacillus boraciitolerans]
MITILTCLISLGFGLFVPFANYWGGRGMMFVAVIAFDLLNIYINERRYGLVTLFFFGGITFSYLYLFLVIQ